MGKARKFLLKHNFKGVPKLSDFELVEEDVRTELYDGEILVKAEWLSVDPYMRMSQTEGEQMIGSQVSRVVRSKCPEFPEGCQVVGGFGWRDLTLYKPEPGGVRIYNTIHRLPDMKGLPDSCALGAVGMPGNTAYYALTKGLGIQPGGTLLITGAAGAVGSVACQIGKIMGCYVIGLTSTEAKVKWLKEELGVDAVFNYKTTDLNSALSSCALDGIDYFLDGVGGTMASTVLAHMKKGGKIVIIGSISNYNIDGSTKSKDSYSRSEVQKRGVHVDYFSVAEWKGHYWMEGLEKLRDWVLQGKINARVTTKEGFLKTPQAFIDLLEGKNIGKEVVKA